MGSPPELNSPSILSNSISEKIRDEPEAGIVLEHGGNKNAKPPVPDYVGTSPNNPALGFINGTTCSNCTVEIFSDPEDQGKIFEATTIADKNGYFEIEKKFTGPTITCTATDEDGNTSKFGCLGDLKLLELDSVQAIFNADRLVKEKPTVIRALIDNSFSESKTFPIRYSFQGKTIVETITIPEKCKKAFYFPEPKVTTKCVYSPHTAKPFSPTITETLQINARLDPNNAIQETNEDNNYMDDTKGLVQTKPIKILYIATDRTPELAVNNAKLAKFAKAASHWVEGTYPVPV